MTQIVDKIKLVERIQSFAVSRSFEGARSWGRQQRGTKRTKTGNSIKLQQQK